MALRPVSELGLVEVTDVAAGEEPTTPRPRARERSAQPQRSSARAAHAQRSPARGSQPKRSPAGAAPPNRPPARSVQPKPNRSPARSAQPKPRRAARPAGADVVQRTHADAGGAERPGLGVSVVSGAAGVAGAILLGRAILRR